MQSRVTLTTTCNNIPIRQTNVTLNIIFCVFFLLPNVFIFSIVKNQKCDCPHYMCSCASVPCFVTNSYDVLFFYVTKRPIQAGTCHLMHVYCDYPTQ